MVQEEVTEKVPRYYMVRAAKGTHPPVNKHKTLADAMKEAARLSQRLGMKCTVLQSFCAVEVIDGKPVWADVTPGK